MPYDISRGAKLLDWGGLERQTLAKCPCFSQFWRFWPLVGHWGTFVQWSGNPQQNYGFEVRFEGSRDFRRDWFCSWRGVLLFRKGIVCGRVFTEALVVGVEGPSIRDACVLEASSAHTIVRIFFQGLFRFLVINCGVAMKNGTCQSPGHESFHSLCRSFHKSSALWRRCQRFHSAPVKLDGRFGARREYSFSARKYSHNFVIGVS